MTLRGRKIWSLGLQLALGFSLVTVLVLGTVGMLLIDHITRRQISERTAKVMAQARVAADLATEVRFMQNPGGLPLALFNFPLQTGVRPIVVGQDGLVIADSWIPSPLERQKLAFHEVQQALQGQEAYGLRQLSESEWALYAAVPMTQSEGPGRAVLVSADVTDLELGLRETRRQLIWGLSSGGIVAILAGFLVAHYVARPLGRLGATAAALAQGDLDARVEPEGSQEVRDLGQRFNLMAEELARADAQLRGFVAAASHEMRTPVATIRAMAEALLNDRQGDLSLYREYLGDIVTEADHAHHVMERLLELARLEGQRNLRPPRTIDLSEVGSDVVEGLLSSAEKRNISLTLKTEDMPVLITGESFLAETVITNLIENALKYTPAGGRVDVSVLTNPARVEVRDTGPGIAPEHIPHLFERFYRVDPSRDRLTGGAGLGLAIAAEAARLLSGRLEVESTLGQGSCFSLVLEAAQE